MTEALSYPDIWNAAIDRAQEELVRQDQFSERTLRILDEQRIERPVPTEQCLSTAHHEGHNWGANPDADGGVWCPGFDGECPVPTTCPSCRHAAHGRWCPNMASANDCSCTFDSSDASVPSPQPPTREQIVVPRELLEALRDWGRNPDRLALLEAIDEHQVLALLQKGGER